MQVPFIVMCIGLTAIGALFAVTLWQMQNRHKRQKEELEYEIAQARYHVSTLQAISGTQSSRIAEYVLTNNKLTEELSIANRTSEMRRKAVADLNKRTVKYTLSALVWPVGEPKAKAHELVLSFTEEDGTKSAIVVRTLMNTAKNKAELNKVAETINSHIARLVS